MSGIAAEGSSSSTGGKEESGDDDGLLYFASVDVADCFHRLRVDKRLSEYCSLPVGTASSFGVTEIDGCSIDPEDWIYPQLSVLPMGFTWRLFFAQTIDGNRVKQNEHLAEGEPIKDRSSQTLITKEHVRYFVHVDTIGIVGMPTMECARCEVRVGTPSLLLYNSKCSTLRGELDSSTPRAFGVFWMVVFEG